MNSRDEWERMIAGWAPVPTKELSMSEEIKLSTEEIDAMRDGLEAIGYGSTAAAIKQLQQQLAAAREALIGLLDYVDCETCTHEETHRGGHIWTICDSCGRKWADDEGGFVPHQDAPAVAIARSTLQRDRQP